jgi:hypothetical protein
MYRAPVLCVTNGKGGGLQHGGTTHELNGVIDTWFNIS